MVRSVSAVVFPAVLAVYLPFCTAAVRPTVVPQEVRLSPLWEPPANLADRDLFNGEWDVTHTPNPHGRYTLLEHKHTGINPGLTVRDALGRKWSVKQAPPNGQPPEGPVEVVLSRLLSAIGYHQPPVYFLPSFTLVDDWGTHTEPGGRFRLHDKALKDRGEWSWQENPFVGTKPYQGLLAILMMVNSSDLKNANNTLYDHRSKEGVERWYVVRDLGMALGTTGRFAPRRADPDAFERQRFVLGVSNGFVRFDFHGWHQELVHDRITTDDLRWASDLLAELSDRQWADAFRAGGYDPQVAARFIRKLQANIARGRQLGHASDVGALARP
jgi:hypothetical protein